MQLKKLSDSHYVVVTDEPIEVGDYSLLNHNGFEPMCLHHHEPVQDGYSGKKITHSTQRLETNEVGNDGFEFDSSSTYPPTTIQPLDLSYIKSLIGEVDVEKKAEEEYYRQLEQRREAALNFNGQVAGRHPDMFGHMEMFHMVRGWEEGYKQCLEDKKDKRFSEEDLRKELASLALEIATEDGELKSCSPSLIYSWIEKRIKSLTQPKDTWEVEIIDGQLKLK